MKVTLRNPTRVIELDGARRVRDLLERLRINPETVLVIQCAYCRAKRSLRTGAPEAEAEARLEAVGEDILPAPEPVAGGAG